MSAAMKGKVCLITGATSGIGAVTAEAMAHQGASVVLVARNREKAQATAALIKKWTGNDAVDYLIADLSSQKEIRRLASEFLDRWPRLDVLVNNAGAVFARRHVSVDGLELTFALNHLGYFLLANLLLDRLKASAPSRIVNVSSEAHHWGGRLDFDDLQGEKYYGGFRAYGRSKLANVLFTKEMARRLEGTGVTANCLHPGVVSTNILGGNGFMGLIWRTITRPFMISPQKGAETSIYLASSPEVEGQTGLYFIKKQPAATSPSATSVDDATRLWRLSEQFVGLNAPIPQPSR